MSESFVARIAPALEGSSDLDGFWNTFERAAEDEGFSFVLYVSQDARGRVYSHANFPIYEQEPPANDPFLAWCCSSYQVTLTGPEYLAEHPYLDRDERRFIEKAGMAGFRSGIGLPVRIASSGWRGGFNLGTTLSRELFERQMRPKTQALHALCLIAHRRLESLARQARPHGGLDALTTRERAILMQMAEGHSRPAIAKTMGITANTVATHVKSIYRKLGIHSRVEAVKLLMSRDD